jgi:hypothetical protein
MSLNLSPEVEAHVLAQAEQACLSVENYLDNLVSQDKQLTAAVRGVEPKSELPPRMNYVPNWSVAWPR